MKKARRLLSLGLALVMLLGLLSACGTKDKQINAAGTDKETLTVAMQSKMNSLDPLTANVGADYYVFNCVFSTLIRFDANDEIYGDLAENYAVSEDQLTYTFTLREGVTFHDGTPLTAEDVVFSIDTRRSNPFTAGYFANVESVTADGNTVTIQLSAKNSNIPLGLVVSYIVPKAQYESLGGEGFGSVLNGSGAFKLESYDEATGSVVVTRNDSYYREMPAIKTINFRVISNPATAAVSLEKGDIDWTLATASTLDSLAGKDGIVCDMSPVNVQYWIYFNTAVAPFNDPALRRAVAYAINTEMAAVASGSGIANTTPWSPVWGDVPSYEKKISYDPARAKELLTEAGYPNGVDIGSFLIQNTQSNVGVQIQSDLAAAGIICELQTVDTNTWVGQFVSKNYTMTICSASGYDKTAAFLGWFRSGSPENYCMYEGADDLLDALSNANTEEDREQRIIDLLNRVAEDAPCLALYDVSMGSAYAKGLVIEAGTLRNTTLDFSTAHWAE